MTDYSGVKTLDFYRLPVDIGAAVAGSQPGGGADTSLRCPYVSDDKGSRRDRRPEIVIKLFVLDACKEACLIEGPTHIVGFAIQSIVAQVTDLHIFKPTPDTSMILVSYGCLD